MKEPSMYNVIMHNDNDGAVPWYQGIEFFMALRRFGHPAWLLEYNDEAHNLNERRNAKDLSIRVTNQWPNRLIYDSSLPAEKRLTRTNINPYKPKSKLMRSGLFGPVRILEEKEK